LRVSTFVFSQPSEPRRDKGFPALVHWNAGFRFPGLVTALHLRPPSLSYYRAFPYTTLALCLLAACGVASVTDAWIALGLFLAFLLVLSLCFYTPTGNHAGARG